MNVRTGGSHGCHMSNHKNYICVIYLPANLSQIIYFYDFFFIIFFFLWVFFFLIDLCLYDFLDFYDLLNKKIIIDKISSNFFF